MSRNGARGLKQERLTVRVTARASETSVTPPDPVQDISWYQVRVPEIPEGGRANEAAIYALAQHLGVAPTRLRIVKGFGSRIKVIEIL